MTSGLEGADLASEDQASEDQASKDLDSEPAARERGAARRGRPQQKRSTRVEVTGWINLDKPVGVTSTQAVGRLKFLFNAKKAGHAGTLDPLASGVLPVAFGEATKTVPIVQEGAKAYRFRVRWGEETATDDAEGEIVSRSEARPSPAEIASLLPRFIGLIEQTPPMFSAIKIDGARAYDLAREGETFEIAARPIQIYRLDLVASEPDCATFEAECGKGAYVRALARDLGRELGCFGHVIELRRMRVGPFSAEAAIPLNSLPDDQELMARAMLPLQAGLVELPMLAVDHNGAGILRRGQALLLRGSAAPEEGPAWASCFGAPIAFGVVKDGYFVSTRVFNMQGGGKRG
jgi:tRNA pseudouridine55 synthase